MSIEQSQGPSHQPQRASSSLPLPPSRQLKRKLSDISQSTNNVAPARPFPAASLNKNMPSSSPNPHQAPCDEDQARTKFSDIFDSREFGSFLSKELPNMPGGSALQSKDSVTSTPFLSKDLPLPKFVLDSGVFKSREAFESLFSSKEWSMDELSRRLSAGQAPAPASDGSKGAKEAAPASRVSTAAPVAAPRPASSSSLRPASVFSSRDWMPMGTLGKHIDVPLSGEIFARSESTASSNDASFRLPARSGSVSEILPPRPPVNGRTDWENMFFSQLQPPSRSSSARTSVSASTATSEPVVVPAAAAAAVSPAPAAVAPEEPVASPAPVVVHPKKKRKRSPRKKVVPDEKVYVEPTDHDVLLGRGGRSNHHPGNKRYRDEVKNLQKWYLESKDKNEKTDISQCLVDYVQSYQGRFLEKDSDGWYIVPDITARRKASQALREDNDAEKRAAKRARFLAKKKRLEEEAQERADGDDV